MSDANKSERFCPVCSKGEQKVRMNPGAGRLDQSGELHIPTTKWTCSTEKCQYTVWDGSTEPWEANDVREARTGKRLTRTRAEIAKTSAATVQ